MSDALLRRGAQVACAGGDARAGVASIDAAAHPIHSRMAASVTMPKYWSASFS
jgi:hypothetical protein